MEVINAGVGGHNTRDMLERLERDCLAHKPSLVILKAGTNDALNSKNLIEPAEIRANLRELADKIRSTGARLLLCTMLTFDEDYLLERHGGRAPYGAIQPRERFDMALQAVRELATTEGLPLVDLHALFTGLGEPRREAESLLRNEANCGARDGVHPNAAGYRVIAAAIWQAIVAHALPVERIVCLGDSITLGQHVQGTGTAGGETYPGLLAGILRFSATAAQMKG